MSAIERITVTLTTDMAQAIRGAVKGGDYASASEVIREALRAWGYKREIQRSQLEKLRADVRAGVIDIEAGRVHGFDADRIVKKGKRRSGDSTSA